MSWYLRRSVLIMLVCLPGVPEIAAGPSQRSRRAPARSPTVRPEELQPGPDEWFWQLQGRTRSASVGRANSGEIRNAVEMPLKGPGWEFVPAIRERGTNWGSDSLVQLLQEAALHVAHRWPGSVLEIGNMGRRDGGKIRQSMSHQSGRDVDLALYAQDAKGRRVRTGNLVSFDERGRTRNGLHMDVERTWALVAFLVDHPHITVQWLFVSDAIRHLLLEHAASIGAPTSTVDRAKEVLRQPSDSNPHADHFHLRIHCNALDVLSGCAEYGPTRPYRSLDEKFVSSELSRWALRTRHPRKEVREEAARRLSSVRTVQAEQELEDLLCSPYPEVTIIAMNTLCRLRDTESASTTLLNAVACAEKSGNAHLLFRRLVNVRIRGIWNKAAENLRDGICQVSQEMSASQQDLCLASIRTLGYSLSLKRGVLLLPLLESQKEDLTQSSREALQRLFTTRSPRGLDLREGGRACADAATAQDWKSFVREHEDEEWRRLAWRNLKTGGIRLRDDVQDSRNVGPLLDVVRRGGIESYSAQVFLAEILRVEFHEVQPHKDSVRFWEAAAKATGPKPLP